VTYMGRGARMRTLDGEKRGRVTEPFALIGDLDFWIEVPEALRRSQVMGVP